MPPNDGEGGSASFLALIFCTRGEHRAVAAAEAPTPRPATELRRRDPNLVFAADVEMQVLFGGHM